jgi:selenocysteine lyase/cysteine desulfurase
MLDRRKLLASVTGLVGLPALVSSRSSSPPAARWPSDGDPRYWEKLRAQFLLRDDEVFLNTATMGAPARVVVDTVSESLRHLAETVAEWDYKPEGPNWFTGYSPETPIREKVGRVVNAAAEEIALTQNATMGMNFIAAGLDLASGDEILQTDQEHPGGRCGWEERSKRQGVAWRTLKIPVPARSPEEIVEIVRSAITPRTKVIAWPHVTSALGTIHPVKEICSLARGKGIFTVIDGAQAVGQIPVDVRDIGCDAYFSSPHKWLLAPAGNGFLYVRKGSAGGIWTTLASSEWANEKDSGYRLQQRGTGNLSLLLGLSAAIDFFDRVGRQRWLGRIKELGDLLRRGLGEIPGVTISSSVHPMMCAGMTTWKLSGFPASKLQDLFWEKARLRPRAVGDEWGVRTSTMIYNSEREIGKLLEITRELAAKNASISS